MRQAERWSIEEARARQLEQVRRIVRLAYDQTAYYRRTFDQAGFHPDAMRSLDDLQKLPTSDKTTLTRHLGEMCARPPTGRDVDYVTTGGTGGTPLGFYIGRDRSAIRADSSLSRK